MSVNRIKYNIKKTLKFTKLWEREGRYDRHTNRGTNSTNLP